jgi:hypothetical protein
VSCIAQTDKAGAAVASVNLQGIQYRYRGGPGGRRNCPALPRWRAGCAIAAAPTTLSDAEYAKYFGRAVQTDRHLPTYSQSSPHDATCRRPLIEAVRPPA